MQAAPHENSGARAARAGARARRATSGRVVVVSVVDEALSRVLDAPPCGGASGSRAEYIRSTRRARGVTNGYRDTWRLGADRWVSAIGAHALARGRTVVIANVGTALTIDAVTADGRHRGGAIVPGRDHGRRACCRARTASAVAPRARKASSRSLFATDTASALAAGADVRGRGVHRSRRGGSGAKTRGPARCCCSPVVGRTALARYIKSSARVVPDLCCAASPISRGDRASRR